MSLQSRMTTTVTVWERTKETDGWIEQAGPVIVACITELSAEGSRRETALNEPATSHRCRCLPDDRLITGRRLVASDGTEYIIRAKRQPARPPGGHLILSLSRMAAATT